MIYFVQPIGGGPIKIGTAIDFDIRIKQLEAHYGVPLVLLAEMEGGREEEAEIHKRFSHLRFGRTEQFRPGPDLLEFINRPLLVSINPDSVEAMTVSPDAAVAILNLKGSVEERECLRAAQRKTGVPITEMGRRGLAMWLKEQGVKPPAEWTGE